MSEKELARELYEHRNAPGEWSEETEEIEVRPRRSSVLSFRLSPEELDVIEQAIESTGESLSEYIRDALSFRMRTNISTPMPGTLNITYGIGSGPYPDYISVSNIIASAGLTVVDGTGTEAACVVPVKTGR